MTNKTEKGSREVEYLTTLKLSEAGELDLPRQWLDARKLKGGSTVEIIKSAIAFYCFREAKILTKLAAELSAH